MQIGKDKWKRAGDHLFFIWFGRLEGNGEKGV